MLLIFFGLIGSFAWTAFLSSAPSGLVNWSAGWAVAVTFLVIPAFLVVYHRHQIQTGERAALIGLAFGGGLACVPLFGSVLALLLGRVPMAIAGILLICCLMSVYTLLAWSAWQLARRLPDRILFQDGTLCPGCAYCLIGTTEFVCPECGRPFTSQELFSAGPYAPDPASGSVNLR